MQDSEWDNLVQQAETAFVEADCVAPDAASQAFTKAERLARAVIDARPHSATGHHLLALCWYNWPGSDPARSARVDDTLSRAHDLDPKDMFVMASLAYQSFDKGDYSAAYAWLQRLDENAFADCGQHWRNLKHDELQLCCRMEESLQADESEVARFIDTYLSTAPENRALPTEMVQTTIRLSNGDAIHAGHVRQMLRLLKDAELAGVFDDARAHLTRVVAGLQDAG